MNTEDGAAFAEAAVMQDGKFTFAGALDNAVSAAGPNYEQVDLEGRLMT